MAGELTPHEGDPAPGEEYDGYLFAGAMFADADAGNCHFLDCEPTGVSFDGARLRKARFTDTRLREVRFVSSDLAEPAGWTPRWPAAPWPGSRTFPPRCAASPSATASSTR